MRTIYVVDRETIEAIAKITDRGLLLPVTAVGSARLALLNIREMLQEISATPDQAGIPDSTKITKCPCPCGKSQHIWYHAENHGHIGYGKTPREAAEHLCRKVRKAFLEE